MLDIKTLSILSFHLTILPHFGQYGLHVVYCIHFLDIFYSAGPVTVLVIAQWHGYKKLQEIEEMAYDTNFM